MSVALSLCPASGVDAANKGRRAGHSEKLRAATEKIEKTVKDQWNMVVVMLDDADVDLLSEPLISYFPAFKTVYSDSVRFRNAFVTTPLCGPSRAAIQRGQYAHRTKILTNAEGMTGLPTEPSGGFGLFYDQNLDLDTLATRLDDAGYHTMLVGKYLHTGFPGNAGNGYVPPGWDEFYASGGGFYYETYRYINGVGAFVGPGLYRTDVERDDAVALLGAAPATPWLLFLTPFAVHAQAGTNPMVAPRHAGLFSDEEIPPSPDFLVPDEWGLYMPISQFRLDLLSEYYRDRLRAMAALDEMLAAVLQAVDDRGELERTVVIVTSDNGYLIGHHRHSGKAVPYDRALRIPLWVHVPGIAPAQTDRLATLADLLPTLIDFGNAEPAGYTDGQSLRPVVLDPDMADWREELLAEGATWLYGGPGLRNVIDSRWTAIITETEKYVEFADGRWMYHDLALDPYELNPSDKASVDREPWRRRLAVLEQCSGDGCRGGAAETAISTSLGSIVPLTQFTIDGFASAPRGLGVSEVRLVLSHTEVGLYWNGNTWQSSYVQVPASLGQPAERTSAWSFQFNGSIPEGEHLSVTARSYDTAGGYDLTPPSLYLTARNGGGDRPDTTLELPNQLQPGPVTISGWVADRSGVERVDLLVNGSPVPVVLGPNPRHELVRTWTAEVFLVSGTNELIASGVDHTGLADLTPATRVVNLP